MTKGYLDGLDSHLDNPPKENKWSPAYKHGWLNGRDDRKGNPRDKADVLRRRSSMISGEKK